MRYDPFSPVFAFSVSLVSTFVAVTEAPTIMPPVRSLIVPAICP